MEKYVYAGKGEGVIGLPHEISEELAEQWKQEYEEKVLDGKSQAELANDPWVILQAALERKTYELVKPARKTKTKPEETGEELIEEAIEGAN